MTDQPSTSRLDRLEAVVEKIAEETRSFQITVRGAFTVQQEQIGANARAIADLAETVKRHDKVLADLERQWQAYLSTIHPKQ
jgi:hypothetical protein